MRALIRSILVVFSVLALLGGFTALAATTQSDYYWRVGTFVALLFSAAALGVAAMTEGIKHPIPHYAEKWWPLARRALLPLLALRILIVEVANGWKQPAAPLVVEAAVAAALTIVAGEILLRATNGWRVKLHRSA